jgi:DNA (cytosine-5)-methyltransferase 1
MRELSLFTGAGGGLLGTHLLGWEPIGYVEWDEYCQQVIAARIADGILPAAPIFTDVREFVQSGAAREYRGFADVVTGGFPCQPFSVAGKRAGADDKRNMWPATIDVIRMVRPRYAFLENVPGILASGYFGTILGDLAESGYDARWRILSAAELGAPHKRDRLWILAVANREANRRIGGAKRETNGFQGEHRAEGCARQLRGAGSNSKDVAHASQRQDNGRGRGVVDGALRGGQGKHAAANAGCEDVADAAGSRPAHDSEGAAWGEQSRRDAIIGCGIRKPTYGESSWWESEPDVGRVADGVAARVDRLRTLGNGQVPAVAATAWRVLTAQDKNEDFFGY